MNYTIVKVVATEAVRLLQEYRAQYQATGQYPFLIGDDVEEIEETASLDEREPAAIIGASFCIDKAQWTADCRQRAEKYRFCEQRVLGQWPGEILEKGSIGLHTDVLSRKPTTEVFLGLAKIEQPWHLPAFVKYGAWNECPEAEVHCAFHRNWQQRFGAEIAGMSGSVVECIVARPPRDRETAIELAWEQYWYCTDIVHQGCRSVASLGATLLNSPYWYFWWD